MTFYDATKDGDIRIKEYEDISGHIAMLLCFGENGPAIKVSSEQAKDLHSTLLRVYCCAIE